jgi:ribosomal protein S18 acetylase RimI-like enzyme
MVAQEQVAPDCRIRPAIVNDTATVKEIVTEAFIGVYANIDHPNPRPTTVDFTPMIARHEVWLVERTTGPSAEPVGAMVLLPGPDRLVVDIVAIRPAEQHRGYGRLAIRFAEAHARARGIAELRLHTNPIFDRNLAFYRRLGFVETGREPHRKRPGSMWVNFVKRIEPDSGTEPDTALDPTRSRAT